MKIGNKLNKLREPQNYTQEYVTYHINISPIQYYKYEKTETPVTINTVEKIAAIYKITHLELLNWDEENIFNFYDNHITNGIAETQNLIDTEGLKILVKQLKTDFF